MFEYLTRVGRSHLGRSLRVAVKVGADGWGRGNWVPVTGTSTGHGTEGRRIWDVGIRGSTASGLTKGIRVRPSRQDHRGVLGWGPFLEFNQLSFCCLFFFFTSPEIS